MLDEVITHRTLHLVLRQLVDGWVDAAPEELSLTYLYSNWLMMG